jgi:hypothetical protein
MNMASSDSRAKDYKLHFSMGGMSRICVHSSKSVAPVVEHFPSMLKALGSIPGNAKKNYTYFKSATVNVA